MDKQLMERLAREAGFLVDNRGRAFIDAATDIGEVNEVSCDKALRRFAALLAEECAKLIEQHHTLKTSTGVEFGVRANSLLASVIREAFHAEPDWRADLLRKIRSVPLDKLPPQIRQLSFPTKRHNFFGPMALLIDTAWLRTASDEDILRAIDASEGPK